MSEQNVYSLSISARATLDMHSLNNEGGEGNQIQTRMVDVVAGDGKLHNVNAISGDMLKHIQAEHLYHIARNGNGLPLCAACRVFDANRISADVQFMEEVAGKTDAEAIDLMIETCTLDDIEGNLLTGEGRSTPRKSVVEFGWVVGVPEITTTDAYFHVKYARERGIEADVDEKARQANLEQRIFHRPASSGVYAIVSHYEVARIGYNDIAQHYALDDAARAARYRALLESVLYTFIQLKGAMRAAQMPHIVAFEGVVSYTTGVLPAPTVSALNVGYTQEIEGVAQALNRLYPGTVVTRPFESLAGFAETMGDLVAQTTPYALAV
ncbi:MAG: DevR family CRISPR-associated autoregulator [Chloroflexota bacterium]|nr:DevR family CRISPR-associated autoregulator [Chloroflexota bacterium]